MQLGEMKNEMTKNYLADYNIKVHVMLNTLYLNTILPVLTHFFSVTWESDFHNAHIRGGNQAIGKLCKFPKAIHAVTDWRGIWIQAV